MIKNYLLTAFRSLLKRKGHAFLNVIGLSLGLAASLLILQYVKDELSYDDFHTNSARIYRVEFDAYRNGEKIFGCATAFPKVAPSLIEEFPEVEDATRLYLRYGGAVVRHEDIAIKESNLFQAEQNLFTIFSYPILEGTPRLDQPNTAVVDADVARKYFGDENPIGKRIKIGNDEDYEITAVMRSPENSHLKFSFLLSYPTLVTLWGEDFNSAWGWYDFYNYVLLREGADPKLLESKLPAFIDKYSGRENASERTTFVLQPLEQIHLYSDLIQEARVNGNGRTVYFLMIIAFFILIIAWINYINLATARAVERAKEVGVRKSVGALKRQLVAQFVSEALLVNLSAAVVGLAILFAAIPGFNQLAEKQLTFSILGNLNLWLTLGGLFLIGSLVSGLYPAFVLSSYKPARVLKGSMAGSKEGILLRKGLVLAQFAASVALIAGTIIVYRQLQFMQSRDLGIDIDRVVAIHGPGFLQADSLYGSYLNVYRNQLAQHPQIKNFTAASEVPGNLIYWTNSAQKLGSDESKANQVYIMGVDYNYFSTFGNELLSGRFFAPEFPADSSSIVINEKSVDIFELGSVESAINQEVRIGSDTFRVVGVVGNYHQEGLKQDFRPTAFRLQQNARSYFCVKLGANDMDQTMAYLKEKYAEVFPNNPFDYFFVDNFFNRQYKNERQFGSVFGFFALLAILIACLGLFGLASFTVAQRTKEIGIRKVMGSSVPNIFMLLSKDFLKLVLLANLFAVPVVLLVMQQWLNTFTFHISIGAMVFVVSALVTVFIALITVSYQSITAALVNPVRSLRYE
ncbi:MAG: ABC transporter permease [Cyclobacteriaceae bacterium]